MTAVFNTSFAITAAAVFTSSHKVDAKRDSVHILVLNTLSGEDKVPYGLLLMCGFPGTPVSVIITAFF